MKKKLSSLLLTLLMLFSVAGCSMQQAEEMAGAVLDATLNAAINAVEDYEDSYTPEDPNALLSGIVPEPGQPKDPSQELNDFINSSLQPDPADPDEIGVIGGAISTVPIISERTDPKIIPIPGEYYYDLEHVVLYIDCYGVLPDNYITKNEARKLGWSGGTPEQYLEGSAIGGDTYKNREKLLPKGDYTECDLNTLGKDSRGAERLVFSDAGEYYYTADHYESFTQVWVEDGEVIYE